MNSEQQILSAHDYHVITKRYLQSDEFKVLKSEEQLLKTFTNPNEAVVKYFSLKLEVSINNVRKNLKFLLKRRETNKEDEENLSKEVFSYEILFKCFKDKYPSFQLDFLPLFYFAKGNNLIVLENLFEKGYVFPKQPLDLAHIKLVLKTLVNFHAGSIGYEETKSRQTGKRYKLIDQNPFLQERNDILKSSWFKTAIAGVNDLIELLPESNLKCKDFKGKLNEFVEGFLGNPARKSEFRTVLCHGSMWGDNILFLYDIKGNPTSCKLLNFEMQQNSPPALDILQLIYWQTTEEIRKHNFHDLLQFYYDNLASELSRGNLDINKILPFEEDFKLSVHQILPLVKLETICLKGIETIPRELTEKFGLSTKAMKAAFKIDETYRKLMTEGIYELSNSIIRPELTLEDCYKIIENKIGTTDYRLLNYRITPLGKMSGYLGDHNRLKIDITESNQKRTLNLFAKFVPKNNVSIQMVADTGACFKEIFIYEQVIPMMKRLGINTIEDCVVPCYFTRNDDVLIFEDFGAQSYMSLDPRQPFTYDIITIIIKKLAKLHASSIILEEKLSEKAKKPYRFGDNYQKECQESLFTRTKNHRGARCMEAGVEEALDHELSLYPDPSCPISEDEMTRRIIRAFDSTYDLVKRSSKFRNVICHGDLWASNLLVKIIDGKPLDCRFIDFQIFRYCPPAQDILTLIYLTTTRKFREQHYDEIIGLYYEQLSRTLQEYGYCVENVFPRKEFLESLEYMLPQAVCQTVIYFQLTLINQSVIKEFMNNENDATNIMLGDRKEFITAMYERDPLFRERSGESIQDLRELCLKYSS